MRQRVHGALGAIPGEALIGVILRITTYTTSHVSNVQTGLDCRTAWQGVVMQDQLS